MKAVAAWFKSHTWLFYVLLVLGIAATLAYMKFFTERGVTNEMIARLVAAGAVGAAVPLLARRGWL